MTLAGWKIHPESGFVFPLKKMSIQKRNCLTILSQCPTHNPTSSGMVSPSDLQQRAPSPWVVARAGRLESDRRFIQAKAGKIVLELFRTKMAKKKLII